MFITRQVFSPFPVLRPPVSSLPRYLANPVLLARDRRMYPGPDARVGREVESWRISDGTCCPSCQTVLESQRKRKERKHEFGADHIDPGNCLNHTASPLWSKTGMYEKATCGGIRALRSAEGEDSEIARLG